MTVPATVVCLDDAVEGAVNLRDLGGYPAAGGRVRRGMVYRSGMMHRISAAGLLHLRRRLDVRTVIDLRSEEELARDGVSAFAEAGIAHQHAPVFARSDLTPEARRVQLQEMRAGVYDWVASYRRMTETGGGAFLRLLTVLAADEHGPAVFHCTAGRDRTGVAAALLLGVLGVDQGTIAADYALAGGFLAPHAARFLRPGPEQQMSEPEMVRLLATSEAAMHEFLAWLTGRHGSIEGYLRQIGATDSLLAAVRARLLERSRW